ncbi:MAG: cysteine hydrolase [Alphaproteobacteria bacterium]|nr:cysteine hydrolase [Alphaproteobacteria bacterium]
MTRPQTLLEMAGVPAQSPQWTGSALVLIDIQREYTEGALPLAGIAEAVAEAARLLEAARKAAAPIFHVAHHGRPGGKLFNPEDPLVRFAPEVEPRPGETIVTKELPNAFAGTKLRELLQPTGRKSLIVAGFATHMCVSATVRAATDLGYRNTVVAGATATRDLPDPLDGTLDAATIQRAALAELADRFAAIVSNADAIIP